MIEILLVLNRFWASRKLENFKYLCTEEAKGRYNMNFQVHFTISNILAIIAGVAIFIKPKLLNLIVAIYLIVTGVIGLLGLKV